MKKSNRNADVMLTAPTNAPELIMLLEEGNAILRRALALREGGHTEKSKQAFEEFRPIQIRIDEIHATVLRRVQSSISIV